MQPPPVNSFHQASVALSQRFAPIMPAAASSRRCSGLKGESCRQRTGLKVERKGVLFRALGGYGRCGEVDAEGAAAADFAVQRDIAPQR